MVDFMQRLITLNTKKVFPLIMVLPILLILFSGLIFNWDKYELPLVGITKEFGSILERIDFLYLQYKFCLKKPF